MKILFVFNLKVGKSAIVGQFLWEEFVKEYRPTVEEFNWIEYNKDDGSKTLLQVGTNYLLNIGKVYRNHF